MYHSGANSFAMTILALGGTVILFEKFDGLRVAREAMDRRIEAFETRVLVGRHPDDQDKLKSAPFPPEIVARFTRQEDQK